MGNLAIPWGHLPGAQVTVEAKKMCNKAKRYFCAVLLVIFGAELWGAEHNNVRPRVREAGIAPGILSPGNLNGITDVEGVKVGHVTLITLPDMSGLEPV